VLFANRAAESIIALRDGLTVVREGLRAALPTETARLQMLIAETLRGSAGGTMRVTRPSLAEPYLLLVAPGRGNWHRSIDAMQTVVIFITALDRAVAPDLRLLAQAFDLTATEAKIVVKIAGGGGVPATARALRISPKPNSQARSCVPRRFWPSTSTTPDKTPTLLQTAQDLKILRPDMMPSANHVM
jgi:hypothetical protein